MDPISAPSFEPAQASPILTCGPAASTEPAATSPEITCRSDTRAGSIHLFTSGVDQTLVSLHEERGLFNTFYPASSYEVMRGWLCLSCEKNKEGVSCRDLGVTA
jgi:hypothetical protein